MIRYIKKFYIRVFALLIITIVLISIQFQRTEELFYKEAEEMNFLSSRLLETKIEGWLDKNVHIVEDLEFIIKNNLDNKNFIKEYFKSNMGKNLDFDSLFYGTKENEMIKEDGWNPPEDFDLRTRPWYILALKTDEVVITKPFFNISKDSYVLTIAKKVTDKDDKFVGVVGACIKLDRLAEIISSYNEIEGGQYFLVDGEDNLIVSNDFATNEVLEEVKGKKTSEIKKLKKNKGYYINYEIKNMGWSILGFIPLEIYNKPIVGIAKITYLFLGIIFIGFLFVLFYQRKHFLKPFVKLNYLIDNIDIKNNLDYRIDLPNGPKEFNNLVTKLNHLLNKVNEHSLQVEKDREEIYSLNEEMEATIEQLVATEQEAISQKMNFESLFKNSIDAIAFFDNKHKVVDINKSFEKLYGYKLDEIRGMNLDDIISGTITKKIEETKEFTRSLFLGNDVNFESTRYGKNNRELYVQIKGVPIIVDGQVIGGFGIYSDVSEKKEKEEALIYTGNHDYLTGAYNRKYFEEKLVELDSLDIFPISIVLADINGLKLINDAFGSKIGDELLKLTYEKLNEFTNKEYIIARLNGDEFAIILPELDELMVEKFVKRLRKNMKKIKVGEINLSVTFGWATKNSLNKDINFVLNEAEDYLYKSKLIDSPNARGNAINTIIETLHEKNKREEKHSKRVSYLSNKFGKALGLSDREVKILKTMGLLHDVGKIAINESILNKAGPLTKDEYEQIKKHPEIGYRILSSVNELSEIADYVLAHHERWDGLGYPKGLSDESIPFLSRIISIADSYDAITSDRAYRNAKSKEFAIEELINNAGSQFDPELVKKFVEMLRDGAFEEEE